MKFMTSITIFLWTVAWFMPDTEPKPRARAVVRWTIAVAMLAEIAMITTQAARGTTSHFNVATMFDNVAFSIMGVGVMFNTAAMVLFLWIVRRDTPPARAGYIWGIRVGLVMFLLASLQGTLIIGNAAHTVGAPDGGRGLPFVNWSTQYGDLRVAHFAAMHAMQGLPLLGFLLDRATRGRGITARGITVRGDEPSGSSIPRNVVIAAGILWVAVTGGLLFMALQGRPLLAL